MLGQLHHVSITCHSISSNLEFYQMFGFEKHKHYEDEEVIITLLKNQGHSHIELFQFKSRADTTDSREFMDIRQPGISHIALQVEDIETCHANLRHTRTCSPIKNARLGGFKYFFTQDPNGNNVEILSTTGE
ncbi:VOC family protein [Vibrio sp. S4M6]|uniref:VOC family protein n=1 Tax=Vibrio sinus TaxID=2946865 RepID=UPI00202A2009|nr:VOC family protein [Vibrio sinus]MCL9783505.1 VOC family protein [Vibrio sinus]